MSVLPKFFRILFYRPNSQGRFLLPPIKEVSRQLNTSLEFEDIYEYEELKQKLNHQSLLVSFVHFDRKLCWLLMQRGSPLAMKWKPFLSCFSELFKHINTPVRGEVALLFLLPSFKDILEGVFRLHGFKSNVVTSLAQLEKIGQKKLSHIVFDQDLLGLKINRSRLGSTREEVITHLKRICVNDRETTVFVVKDFQQGSLFDDMNSSVKDISNLLLSHEEYILFIKTFLKHLSFQKAVQEKEKLCEELRLPYSDKNPWKLLKNPKNIYSELTGGKGGGVQELPESDLVSSSFTDWRIRELLLEWLFAYAEEIKNRASSKFMRGRVEAKGPVSTGLPLTKSLRVVPKACGAASKPSDVPDQKRNVLPHLISRLSNEPEKRAGGPK